MNDAAVVVRNPKAMNLPTKSDINPDGDCYDGRTAVQHFFGKSRGQITREWAEHGEAYREDLSAMGPKAFCFYLPAVVDYFTTHAISDHNDTVEDVCFVIETRLDYDGAEIREVIPDIVRLADYVMAQRSGFEPAPDAPGDLQPRLDAIKQTCAELGSLSNPLLWKRRKAPKHLESARNLLPSAPKEAADAFERLLASYGRCLENSNFEDALDVLEELGDLVPCRGGYWRNLERAAEAMDLIDRMPLLRSRFEQTLP